ncbi:hypothetical protein AB7M22_002939 [Pseudomonas sp. ADAK2 TE3594]
MSAKQKNPLFIHGQPSMGLPSRKNWWWICSLAVVVVRAPVLPGPTESRTLR